MKDWTDPDLEALTSFHKYLTERTSESITSVLADFSNQGCFHIIDLDTVNKRYPQGYKIASRHLDGNSLEGKEELAGVLYVHFYLHRNGERAVYDIGSMPNRDEQAQPPTTVRTRFPVIQVPE